MALDEPLLELETDKVTIEVNAPIAGNLIEILANVGDEVEVGAVLGRLGSSEGAKIPASTVFASEPSEMFSSK